MVTSTFKLAPCAWLKLVRVGRRVGVNRPYSNVHSRLLNQSIASDDDDDDDVRENESQKTDDEKSSFIIGIPRLIS
jgi:hypothetical protein